MTPTDSRRLSWTLWAFVAAAILVASVLVWQLVGLTPEAWCAITKAAAPSDTTSRIGACLNVLVRLLDIKDHTIIGLLVLLGIVVVSLAVVALGVNVRGSGPGGFSVDIDADKTQVDAPGGSVTIPTPPSANTKET